MKHVFRRNSTMAIRDSFEIEPPPILADEIENTFTTDVVVVGAGTAGKAAALSAAQAGAKVIQIDKHVTYRYSGGIIAAIDSRLQKKLGIAVDKEKVILALMKWGANQPDQKMIRLWADHSGPVLDWLMDMTDAADIETVMYQWPQPAGFVPNTEAYEEFPVGHFHTDGKTRILNHSLALECVQNHTLELGVDIRYRTRALRLIRQNKGRVTGVIARDVDGCYVRFNARRAVVLCTGDYGSNPAMMQKYCPVASEVARVNNIYMVRNEDLRLAPEPLNVGDGHLMAMWIGGVMEPGPHAPMSHSALGPMGVNPFLRVNIRGVRYENEDVPGQHVANALCRQPGKKAWQIFDAKWEQEISRMGLGLGRFFELNDLVRNRFADLAIQADTIEALARKIEIPAATFRATVDRYNELARLGRDLDFGKRPDRLTAIEKPPFYAGLLEQEFLVVLGGLNTNVQLQMLDAAGDVIPGIYLAGNTVGNRFAVDYPTMCPGLSHGMAWTTGRLSGLSAAAERA
jgi:fumarate reductase flavoprotein subunit